MTLRSISDTCNIPDIYPGFSYVLFIFDNGLFTSLGYLHITELIQLNLFDILFFDIL